MARGPSAKHQPVGGALKNFLLEFVSVTLGVLLALVLEQAATNWRERQRVADLRVTMNEEIAEFGDIFRLRQRLSPCVIRKLDALETFLRGGGPRAPVKDVGRPNFYFSSRGSWDSDASDQLSRYLGAARFKLYGELYQGMAEYGSLSAEEQNSWVVLQTLEGDPDAMTPERRARLREAVASARNKNALLIAIANKTLADVRAIGVKPTGGLDNVAVETAAICKPLASGKPPAGG
jgi:hypothetical protein